MCHGSNIQQDEGQLQYDTAGTDQQYYLGAVNCIHCKEEVWYVDLKMGAVHITFKIDSGADIMVIRHTTNSTIS